jgi:hypothetical protein
MAIFLALMFGLGVAVSVGACELEVGQSFLHYSIYFVATLVLALIAGVELAQPLSSQSKTDAYGIPTRPGSVQLPATRQSQGEPPTAQ